MSVCGGGTMGAKSCLCSSGFSGGAEEPPFHFQGGRLGGASNRCRLRHAGFARGTDEGVRPYTARPSPDSRRRLSPQIGSQNSATWGWGGPSKGRRLSLVGSTVRALVEAQETR